MPASPLDVRRTSPRALLPVLLAALGFPLGASAQEPAERPDEACPMGRVADIFVDNHSIFDPAALPEDDRIRWAYRLANRLHVRTREEFIRRELLVREGECYDPARVRESARILREFRFIATADAFSIPQPDGTRHVVVDTRDEWTFKISVGVRFEDGLQFDGAGAVEENFLGRGITVGAFYLDRDERRDVGGLLEMPAIGSSRWDFRLDASRTRVGNSGSQLFMLPFRGEWSGFAFRQRVAARKDLFNWSLPPDQPYSHLVAPVDEGRMELTGAWRFGAPGDLLMVGTGISREWVHPGSLAEVEGVIDGEFDDREPAAPTLRNVLESQLGSRETVRANLLLGLRQVEHVQRRGLDALDGVQDVAVGREAVLTVSPALGGTGPGDAFFRTDLFGGASGEESTAQIFVSGQMRSVWGSRAGARDVLGEVHAFVYRELPGRAKQTLVLRGRAQGAWRTHAPFQLTLGGPDGVRGYGEHDLPGGRSLVLSLEDRIRIPNPFPDLMDLGLTAFGDVGRMFAGDAPFGRDSGWRGTLGAGIRIGFPAGTASVIRADLAFPIGPGGGRGPVFRIHAREWLGVAGDFRSLQMERARRSGVRGEFVGVSRERSDR